MYYPIAAILLLAACVGAQVETLEESALSIEQMPDHYCGIYCVYAAASVLQKPIEFVKLADVRYVPTDEGSSAHDLIAALGVHGLKGQLHGFLTIDRLRQINRPTILHVRNSGSGARYSHWVLFLGFGEDSQVRLYDPPRDIGVLTASELLSIWDGIGISVSDSEEEPAADVPASFSYLSIILCSGLLLAFFSTLLRGWILIAAVSGALATVGHTLSSNGFVWSPQSIRNVTGAFNTLDAPVITFEEAKKRHSSGKSVFIDARVHSDFQRSHIPGALSIPIQSSYLSLRRIASSLGNASDVVVYCQSSQCGWADQIASELLNRDIKNVVIYRGGFAEWKSSCGGD